MSQDIIDKIKDDIENNTLAGVYETLLNEYIVKPTAWWTMVELYPMLMYKHDNGNLVTRQSENTTAITQGELSSLRDMARENANYYTQMLVDYLIQIPFCVVMVYLKPYLQLMISRLHWIAI